MLLLLQGQAEYFLEKLHGMAEKQVGSFLDGAEQVDGWAKFRENLIGLTDVTRTHFHKLVSVRRSFCPKGNQNKHGAPLAKVQEADWGNDRLQADVPQIVLDTLVRLQLSHADVWATCQQHRQCITL